MKKILATILTLICLSARGQGLSGEWYGWANVNDIYDASNYMVHMDLDQRGGDVVGRMSLYYMDVYREFPVVGVFDSRRGVFMISDLEIPRHFPSLPGMKKMEMDVYLVAHVFNYRTGAQIKGQIIDKTYGSVKNINFVMTRPSTYKAQDGTEEREPSSDGQAPQSRRTLITHEIEVESDSIEMSLYDGAVVDHDTVSVFYNGSRVLDRVHLDGTGTKLRLGLDPSSPSHTLVLQAENLGSIPPNTGVLIINVGQKRYELFFANSMAVSTGIKFWRRIR